MRRFGYLWVTVCIVCANVPEVRGDTRENQEIRSSNTERSFSNAILIGIAVPLNGTLYLAWARPLTNKLVISSYAAFFERDWMLILPKKGAEKGEWHSNSGYLGTMLQFFPTSASGVFKGYYIGGDIGIAVSYQTYLPLDKSDVFFFPYIELYFFGYLFEIWKGLFVDFGLGGGYAPVSKVVNIEGHVNEGDFYPLAFMNLGYRW